MSDHFTTLRSKGLNSVNIRSEIWKRFVNKKLLFTCNFNVKELCHKCFLIILYFSTTKNIPHNIHKGWLFERFCSNVGKNYYTTSLVLCLFRDMNIVWSFLFWRWASELLHYITLKNTVQKLNFFIKDFFISFLRISSDVTCGFGHIYWR